MPFAAWLALCMTGGLVHAATFGLLLIPTADTVGANQYQLQFELDGSLSQASTQYWFLDTEFGLGDRWELGVDINLRQSPSPRVFANWKYTFAPVGLGRVGVAVGVDNWDEKPATGPYALTTTDFGPVRITAGTTYLFGSQRLLTGIDTGFRHRLTWVADYISGPSLFTSFGANYVISDSLQIQAGVVLPNSGGGTLFTIQVALTGRYRGRGK
jgi:hypothetical protein